jgi:hypothetical protein
MLTFDPSRSLEPDVRVRGKTKPGDFSRPVTKLGAEAEGGRIRNELGVQGEPRETTATLWLKLYPEMAIRRFASV